MQCPKFSGWIYKRCYLNDSTFHPKLHETFLHHAPLHGHRPLPFPSGSTQIRQLSRSTVRVGTLDKKRTVIDIASSIDPQETPLYNKVIISRWNKVQGIMLCVAVNATWTDTLPSQKTNMCVEGSPQNTWFVESLASERSLDLEKRAGSNKWAHIYWNYRLSDNWQSSHPGCYL